jgi:2'-hydroxyisoflavone reductase
VRAGVGRPAWLGYATWLRGDATGQLLRSQQYARSVRMAETLSRSLDAPDVADHLPPQPRAAGDKGLNCNSPAAPPAIGTADAAAVVGYWTALPVERLAVAGCGQRPAQDLAGVTGCPVRPGSRCRGWVAKMGAMRLLVLGGSWFLGRAVVETALDRGLEVTTFRRGVSGGADPDGVRSIRGDRTNPANLEHLTSAGPWDAVVDTTGYVPREALAVARALEPVVGRYVFVSTVSVYQGWPAEPLTDASSVLECPPDVGADYGYDGDPGPSVYGFTKAGCERAIVETFGWERTTILRPGVILGPREYVGRLPWWLRRLECGGPVLAPGDPDRRIQPVDVRDVAAFALHSATVPAGTFNVTAAGVDTFGSFLADCAAVTESDAELAWVADDFLVELGVRQWTELPLWRTYAGAWDVDSACARAAGLVTRPLAETVADTWKWLQSGGGGVEHERASELGITPQREAEVLAAWRAR